MCKFPSQVKVEMYSLKTSISLNSISTEMSEHLTEPFSTFSIPYKPTLSRPTKISEPFELALIRHLVEGFNENSWQKALSVPN